MCEGTNTNKRNSYQEQRANLFRHFDMNTEIIKLRNLKLIHFKKKNVISFFDDKKLGKEENYLWKYAYY